MKNNFYFKPVNPAKKGSVTYKLFRNNSYVGLVVCNNHMQVTTEKNLKLTSDEYSKIMALHTKRVKAVI